MCGVQKLIPIVLKRMKRVLACRTPDTSALVKPRKFGTPQSDTKQSSGRILDSIKTDTVFEPTLSVRTPNKGRIEYGFSHFRVPPTPTEVFSCTFIFIRICIRFL